MSTIRRAHRADAPAVADLWRRLYEAQYRLDGRFQPAPDALARWENDFREWIHSDLHRILVAEREGEVVGFATAQLRVSPPIFAPGYEVFVDQVFVHPDFRRVGYGKRLIEAVKEWAAERGARRITAGTAYRNTEAAAFWERCGAEPLAVTLSIELQEAEPPAQPKEKRLGFV